MKRSFGPAAHGIPVKKQFGQHFLRNKKVVDHMIEAVALDQSSSVFEIGCGDGFLTRAILAEKLARLWVFEIDPDWAEYVRKELPDDRLEIFIENILDVDFDRFIPHQPWILLANLPYQVTFPIMHKLQENRHLLQEGVVMVQEEVAQKICKTRGRGYGFVSLFFQHFFDWKLLDKIPPTDFFPPPKVTSRLLYFKPKKDLLHIDNEEEFWKFIKQCFKQPRRTLKNNLAQGHFDMAKLDEATLQKRAQEMGIEDFLEIWAKIS